MGGPQDVPNYSTYTYLAAGGVTSQCGWINAFHGELQGNLTLQTARILWNWQTAAVGMAVYEASRNFIWGYDVNQVAVTLAPGGTLSVKGSVPNQFMYANQQFTMTGPQALNTNVCKVVGGNAQPPSRNPDQRGMKFINVGYVQAATFANEALQYKSAGGVFSVNEEEIYGGGGKPAPMIGTTVLDTWPGSKNYWFDSNSLSMIAKNRDPRLGILTLRNQRPGIPFTRSGSAPLISLYGPDAPVPGHNINADKPYALEAVDSPNFPFNLCRAFLISILIFRRSFT